MLDPQTRATVWNMTKGRCHYCGVQTNPFATFTIDHIVPRALGGSDGLDNLVPCCQRCNASKGAKVLDQWTPGRPFWFLTDEYRDGYAWRRDTALWDWSMGQVTDEPVEDVLV